MLRLLDPMTDVQPGRYIGITSRLTFSRYELDFCASLLAVQKCPRLAGYVQHCVNQVPEFTVDPEGKRRRNTESITIELPAHVVRLVGEWIYTNSRDQADAVAEALAILNTPKEHDANG